MQVRYVMLTLNDGYYIHIGAILSKWATLEYLMQGIIWKTMGLENEEGRTLTIGMGSIVLSGILRTLTRKWITEPSTVTAIKKLANLVSDNAHLRHKISHGVWTCLPEDQIPHLNYMKESHQRILPEVEAVTPEKLREFSIALDIFNRLATSIINAVPDGKVALQDIPA